MKQSLTIIDDFLDIPDSVREFALAHDFNKRPEYDGHVYPHFSPVKDERFLRWLEKKIALAIGVQVQIKLGTFTCLQASQGSPQWIHSDDICASYAGVLYLFKEPGYGTAFWRHSEYAADRLDEVHFSDLENDVSTLNRDGMTKDAWSRSDVVDSRYNRFIFYPTSRFHSRAIEHGFGESPERARLTLAVFFDIITQ